MNLRAFSLALAASLALGGAARAADLGEFEKLCVATHADPQAALAAADAAGWMAVPEALLAQLRRPGLESAQGRLKTDSGGMRFMLAAGGATMPSVPNLKMNACVVGFAPADPTIADQVKAWIGVPELTAMSKNGMHGYAYVEDHGHRQTVAELGSDPVQIFKTHQVDIVLVQDQPQATLVVLGIPSLTSAH